MPANIGSCQLSHPDMAFAGSNGEMPREAGLQKSSVISFLTIACK